MKLPSADRISGSTTRVADCYIWAGISSLDSPTDYREFLPKANKDVRKMPGGNEFVLLDDIIPLWKILMVWLLALASIACVLGSLALLLDPGI